MAIFRGAGGPGDATTDAANEASVASTKAAEAEASATAAASSAISASNSATTAINSKDAAATSESNAATSALAASTSEANASTSASAADTSATAAQTAQTAAEAAKTAAETAETGAEVAQTAAESAQTAAELAQTGAETAETNAETAQAAAESALASTLSTLDEFDDIYLGAKASPPNTDNDGNTLQTGAIYWDTGDNQLYIWDGANWDAAAFNVTGAVTSFNTRTGAVTLQNNDVTTAVGQSLQVGDSPTFAGLTATGNIAVTGTVDGRDVATDGTKLDGIETGATADQTAGEIKTAYESNADTNAFTDAEQTKLAGIETSADVTDTTNVTAAGAVMDSELTSEASVKALDQGVATIDSPSFAGLTTTANINFGDNDRAIFGAGSDLQIYHNGANSYIDDTGTGNLYIRASDTVRLQSATGEQGVIVTTDGAVTLYHDNGAKLSTTATGIDVTGTVVSDGLTVDTNTLYVDSTNNRVGIGTSSPAVKLHVSSTGTPIFRIQDADGSDYYAQISQATGNTIFDTRFGASNGAFIFRGLGGGTADEYMRITSTGNVGIGLTSPSVPLDVNGITRTANAYSLSYSGVPGSTSAFGAGTISTDGNWGMYFRATTGAAIADFAWVNGAGTERMRITSTGNVGIGTSSPNAKVEIVNTSAGAVATQLFLHNASDTDGTGARLDFAGLSGGTTTTGSISNIRVGSGNYALTFNTFGGGSNAERMRIDSSGNVGIGRTPNYKLDAYLSGTGSPAIASSNDNTVTILQSVGSSQGNVGTLTSHPLVFVTANAERMRIDTSGNVLVGTTAANGVGLTLGNQAANSGVPYIVFNKSLSGTVVVQYFYYNGVGVGSITTSNTATAYVTSSDYRLKEDWQPMSGSVDRVKALKPVNFAWKLDGSRVDGFLAHEAQAVVPEAVTGTHNEVDADGNPVMQGIDQSKLVPLLTAALQEAITKIEALEARVATLESN